MRLTEISIKNLQAPAMGQTTYSDDLVPGFGVRVSQGGVRSFVLVYGRNRKRVTLGRYPVISLQDARTKARELLAERTLGKRDAPSIKFEDAMALFLSTHYPENSPKPRTKADTERLLRKHFLTPLRYEKIADIHTYTISEFIDRLQDTPSEARHAFAAIRLFMGWAVGRGYITRSPCEGLQPPPLGVSRNRVLTGDELKKVLKQARSGGSNFNNLVQLLIYTGQRRSEIASIRAEWIDFDKRTITLPPAITKNKRQHTFPFGKMAEAVLRKGAEEGLLFPARGKDTPFNGWSKAKAALDKSCAIAPWTIHDLRRTCATNIAALGIPVQVTEKLLNHVSGTTGGIVAVYQRHTYLDEMREAVETWEAHLKKLLSIRRS